MIRFRALYDPMFPLRPFAPSMVLCCSAAQAFYSRLSPSKALCPLYSTLPPLRPSVPSMALSSLYDALFPLRPSFLSMTLCFLNSPLSSLPTSVSSTALFPLYRPLSPKGPSVLSTALCFLLYCPLSPLKPSVPSMALCSLCGPLKTAKKAKLPFLFREMFWKTHLVKTPRVVGIYFVLAMITIMR